MTRFSWTSTQHADTSANLEEYVDRFGLEEVLDMLAGICAGKAEHIRTNYQDEGLVPLCGEAGSEVVCCSESEPVRTVVQAIRVQGADIGWVPKS